MRTLTEKTYNVVFNIGDLLIDFSKNNNTECPNTLTIPYLVKKGFGREEVVKLFAELEQKGFLKQFIQGKVGKGNPTTIIVNEKCPVTYTITMTVKRLSKSKALILRSELQEQENKAAQNSVSNKPTAATVADNQNKTAIDLFLINAKRKPIKPLPVRELNPGYACTFGDGYVFIDKVSFAGYNTIQEAVENVWEELEGRVSEIYKSKIMRPEEQVASILMGRGYIKLTT